MAITIITKNSATPGSVPSGGSLTQGELAVNVADKKLFTKDSGGTVITLSDGSLSLATPLTVVGNNTAGSEIRLPEDTDNGSNYVALKAADSIASNISFTLPAADGTNGQSLVTDGSGNLTFATPTAGITTGKARAMAMIFGF
jgi:hypothetical protein